LPGKYAEPEGQILLAWANGGGEEKLAGIVAMRPLEDDGICELKRLYLRDEFRGQGAGRQLTEDIIYFAQKAGYEKMRLDTERRLQTAIDMYRKFGFVEIGQYYDNPMAQILYMEKQLN
jgi:ribosomal protein S18 acetylase RimI-like enzyme|tara:strand:- start:3482 stop:3838 length:357 start_codon:yes stop_codon:yes gene_type:complete